MPASVRTTSLAFVSACAMSGCAALNDISNREPVAQGESYQAQYRSDEPAAVGEGSVSANLRKCNSDGETSSLSAVKSVLPDVEKLSPGDLLDIAVGSDETFSGKYEVSQDGTLKLRHLGNVAAFGRGTAEIEADIVRALIAKAFYNVAPRVSVRVADFASARVFVSGAVFEAGTVSIGGAIGPAIDSARQQALGGTAEGRRLSRALQGAGGVRPDADLARITLKRGRSRQVIDVRPAIAGRPYSDLVLLSGDQIEVPSRGCFQEALMTPSPISPLGAKVFMSNLTQPAVSNSNSAIGKEARELRYGTRFIQALVGTNCVGGAKFTNADRSAVLYTRNPMTGESIVIERRIEDLLRRGDRDDYDPFILPNDAIACYDSAMTNVAEVAKTIGVVAGVRTLVLK